MKAMSKSAGTAAAIASLSLLVFPAFGQADGPPLGGWSTTGVAVGKVRYVALPSRHSTLLEQIAVRGGRLLRYSTIRGQLGVPMVALDGSGGGLSQNGTTLVLTRPRTSYPARRSVFYLVDPKTLSVRTALRLKGDFSFDAISPDASTLYLIELSSRSFLRYSVRALDIATGRLLRKPVVDPREPDEAMRGYPYARAMSADGRFAYTLYSGGKKPFVHALDTTGRTAACIDIPPIPGNAQMSLRLNGRRLSVLADGAPVSYVDTLTRKVTSATAAGAARSAPTHENAGGGQPLLWALLAGAAAAALGAGAAISARRRRAA
jgi:hypothetical protein